MGVKQGQGSVLWATRTFLGVCAAWSVLVHCVVLP